MNKLEIAKLKSQAENCRRIADTYNDGVSFRKALLERAAVIDKEVAAAEQEESK